MALQYVNKQTIGTLYINDAGDVTVDGVAKPGAVVTKGTDGALRVQVDGQTVDIGWDEDTVPLTDVAITTGRGRQHRSRRARATRRAGAAPAGHYANL